MQTYRYTAISDKGARVTGVVEAQDEYAAVSKIRLNYPIIEKISEVKPAKQSFLNKDIGTVKIDEKALSVMCSQFSTILQAGVDISSAMGMIAQQTQDKRLRAMLESSAKDVAGGSSIASSMQKNLPQLPLTFIETIRAGEQSGTLEDSFATMQKYYEKNYKLKQRVRQALSYPIFVVVLAIIVLMVVMIKVIPTMTEVFSSLGGELPLMTRIMIAISAFFSKWWILIILVIAALIILFQIWTHSEKGRMKWAIHQLHSRITGKIHMYTGCASFATTMSALLQAGLPLTSSLKTTAKVLDNYKLSRATEELSEKVATGMKLGDAMRKAGIFPQTLTEMTAIGENTGELEKTLQTTGEYYTNEANAAMTDAINKLEPTLLIVLAIFAGFIVISIYLPMFTMYDLM